MPEGSIEKNVPTAPTACTHSVSGYYFTPLAGVLFAFPSRYWFTIGQLRVFSLGGWSPPCSDRISRVPALLDFTKRPFSHTGLSPTMARLSKRFR